MNNQIHQFTSMCWDKYVRFNFSSFRLEFDGTVISIRCISGTPSTSFSKSEQKCLQNCVDRFLDTSMVLVNYVEQRRLEGGR